MQTVIVSVALAGSLGAAWAIQKALLELCLKAMDYSRSDSIFANRDERSSD
jgi:hypothetical protein